MSREEIGLCYSIPDQPIYGEFTPASYQRIATLLLQVPPLDGICSIFDAGSGSGRGLLVLWNTFLAQGARVKLLLGVESSRYRSQVSVRVLGMAPHAITLGDILDQTSLPGVTHCYAFDHAFPRDVRLHLKLLADQSPTVVAIATTRPTEYLADSSSWRLVGTTKGSFSGGNGTCTASVFAKL